MYYQIYKDTRREWRWRLRAANHRIVAHGESYKNRADCVRAISIMRASADAPIRELTAAVKAS